MPNKIKVILILVAIVAVFSVYKLTQYVHKIANESSTYQDGSALANSDNDSDQDGLTNREESYWNTDFQNPDTDGDGFLDGEEVASGHDPSKPGPDDAIVSAKNLTEKSSALLVSGLAEGSLKVSSIKFDKSIDSVVDDLFYQSTINYQKTTLNNLVTEPIVTIGSDQKSVQEYLKKMNSVLALFWLDDLKGFINVLNIFQELDKTQNYKDPKFKDSIDNEVARFENQIKQLETIPTPSNWIDVHGQLVLKMQSMAKNYLLFKNIGDDPMQGTISYITLSREFTEDLPALLNLYVLKK
ncbi:MAG: hypothetical protein UU70_C0020G0003 [Candidatus Yanofskybacteria bacterium GW2011_GWA1_41_6]|uniref:EF-hand domain-containing protein n=1 Tax=Candidatus Yanofskybacteria bacterium GW2011_GWA1_41_6 TaxID=1619020 RepID=A0A0G0ZJU7_9BACT|nr:MAG: hypothetical protein UU70_C0020G0003 [Candidatus Yanofskybacteria bacterium GW2011_GWA1_41_6]